MQKTSKRHKSRALSACFAFILLLIYVFLVISPGNIDASSVSSVSGSPASGQKSAVPSVTESASLPEDPGEIDEEGLIENNYRKGMVSAGLYHTVLLREDGRVYSWGDNAYGQLGIGTVESEDSPTLVPGLVNIIMVRAGAYHTLALSADGNVYAWGRNTFGQIGDGTSIASLSPILIESIPPVKEIAAGAFHSLALSIDGKVYAWGNNNEFQVGDVVSENITDDTGNILGKRVLTPQLIVESGAKAISAGGNHSLYLNNSGQVCAWGNNKNGQLGDGSQVSRGMPAIIPGLSSIIKISAGYSHNMAVKEDSVKESNSVITYQNLYVWGSDSDGQLGLGNTFDQDRYVDRPTRVDVNNDSNLQNDRISLIQAGYSNSMITVPETRKGKRYDSIYIWGNNTYGQLGIGNLPSQSSPVILTATSNGWTGDLFLPFQSMAIGGYHAVFLSVKGFVGTAGRANKGQLGNVSVIDCKTPIGIIVPDAIAPEWIKTENLQVLIQKQVVKVSWPPAKDNIKVTGYEVSYIGRDKRLKNRIIDEGLKYDINDFDMTISQTINVKAIDESGNKSYSPLEYLYTITSDKAAITASSSAAFSTGVTEEAAETQPDVTDGIPEIIPEQADPLAWSPGLYGTITHLEVPWDVDYIYGTGVVSPPEDYSWLIALILTITIVSFFLVLITISFRRKHKGHSLFKGMVKTIVSKKKPSENDSANDRYGQTVQIGDGIELIHEDEPDIEVKKKKENKKEKKKGKKNTGDMHE